MSIDRRYPLLVGLYAELKRFVEEEPSAKPLASTVEISEGRDRTRIHYGELGLFWLDARQSRVVEELIDARLSAGSPDVSQAVLIQASGAKVHRLADVFRGSPAWNRLVVPGDTPGTYRVPAPDSGGGPDDAA